VLKLPALFKAKAVLLLAYTRAKNTHGAGGSGSASSKKDPAAAGLGESYVERHEFRMLLLYIAAYYDLWLVFGAVATANKDSAGGSGEVGDESYITRSELEAAFALERAAAKGKGQAGVLGASGAASASAAFAAMNSDGGEKVSFREFARWALKQLSVRIAAAAAAAATAEAYQTAPAPAVSPEAIVTTDPPRMPSPPPQRLPSPPSDAASPIALEVPPQAPSAATVEAAAPARPEAQAVDAAPKPGEAASTTDSRGLPGDEETPAEGENESQYDEGAGSAAPPVPADAQFTYPIGGGHGVLL
jgi:hypothetical protein